MYSILSLIIVAFLGCSKSNDSSAIIGKWYHASTDTKIARSPNCVLKDTVNTFTRDNTMSIYEFFSDGKMIVTVRSSGQLQSGEAKYTLENGKMTWVFNGQSSPPFNVSNLDGSNWRYEQDGRYYCTSPYYNFKKY